MNLYLMRHSEAEWGEPLDPTRELTSIGREQTATMADFMVRQIGRVDLVLSSWFRRARDTADPMAAALGNAPREDLSTLDPDGKVADAWSDIQNLAEIHNAKDVLIVSHHPLVNDLLYYLAGAKTSDVSYTHAAIAALVTDDAGTDVLAWMAGPPQVERDDEAVIEAAIQVADSLLESLGMRLEEKKGGGERNKQGSYYYDTQGMKRWVLGDGGQSGNCELCEENADAGWIPEDDEYPNTDEPPQHFNCTCTEETKDKRVRVYV